MPNLGVTAALYHTASFIPLINNVLALSPKLAMHSDANVIPPQAHVTSLTFTWGRTQTLSQTSHSRWSAAALSQRRHLRSSSAPDRDLAIHAGAHWPRLQLAPTHLQHTQALHLRIPHAGAALESLHFHLLKILRGYAVTEVERWPDGPIEFHFAMIMSLWVHRALIAGGFGTGAPTASELTEIAAVMPYRTGRHAAGRGQASGPRVAGGGAV
ncbi:hypothetical protein B0H21DRAFT_848666 [Amylocystis lapponica]|nr:hypothetical protein B0H21DRAFT_848666 [Amylocystis lapponica]